MAILDYITLDVFTSTRFAGNPLAVVHLPAGHTVTQAQKQAIAREFNYSETTFLHAQDQSSSSTPTWTVDIFLVDAELPFAGHPTIGTAVHALSSLAAKSTHGSDSAAPAADTIYGRFNVKAGPIDLSYSPSTGAACAAIPHDIHLHGTQYAASELWKLQPELRRQMQGAVPRAMDVLSVVKGMTNVFVELPDLEALAACKLFAGRLEDGVVRDQGWESGVLMTMFYVVLDPKDGVGEGGVQRLRTRMIEGRFEDPATGSASCGLGALLALKRGIRGARVKFDMVQAIEMGRRSDIGIEVVMDEDGKVDTIEMIGKAVQVMEGKIAYEA